MSIFTCTFTSSIYRQTLLFFVVFIIKSFHSIAQELPPPAQNYDYKFEHLTPDDGLSQSTVICLFQDSKGYLWIGTEDGLNRYDGYEFKIYRNNPEDSASISANYISTIAEDKDGNLWIGTSNGLNRFDPINEKFESLKFDKSDTSSISSDAILKIFLDRDSNLWIGTGNFAEMKGMLNQYQYQQKIFKRYPVKIGTLNAGQIRALCEDKYSNLWVGTDNGIFIFDTALGIFKHIIRPNPSDPNSLGNIHVYSIKVTTNGKMWVCGIHDSGVGGVSQIDILNSNYDFSIRNYFRDLQNENTILDYNTYDLVEADNGKIWIATPQGVSVLDTIQSSFYNIQTDMLNPATISDNSINAILKDKSGIIWLGYGAKGLSKLVTNKGFIQIHQIPRNERSLITNIVFASVQDRQGNLWVGSMGGGLNKIVFEQKKPTSPYTVKQFLGGNSKVPRHFNSISEDSDGTLWIGAYDGVYHFDPHTEIFRHSIKHNGTVREVFKASDSNYWIGTTGGLFRMDERKSASPKFIQKISSLKISDSFQDLIMSIAEDKNKNLWIATRLGTVYCQTKNKKFKVVIEPVQSRLVYVSLVSSDGHFWLGTTQGLFKYKILEHDKTEAGISVDLVKHYHDHNSTLPNSSIYDILEDLHGNLWLGHNRGLSRLHVQSESFKNYLIEGGPQANQFNTNAGCNLEQGYLCFGGLNGITIFHPDSLKDNVYIPPIVITKLNVLNKPRPVSGTTVTLKYFENVLNFEFASLDFNNPSKNQYAYQMIGFDEDWINSGNRRNTTYTNLDPGTYTFKVKGSNNDGVWNEVGASIAITILPPPWKTWLAYSSYGIGLIIILFIARNEIIKRERLKAKTKLKELEAEKYHELDTLKSRFFANISHEFRTPLTLILGPLQKRLETVTNTKDKVEFETMQRNASRLLTLVNQLLDLSRIEAGMLTLKCKKGNLTEFIVSLASQFSSIADSKKIKFHVQSGINIPIYFDPDKLEKIVTNLLSNAFKFTPMGGTIEVLLAKGTPDNHFQEGYAEIKVTDSGPGIANNYLEKIFDRFYQIDSSTTRPHEGSGIGLALTKELVELHRGTITVTSRPEQGSQFIVCLPVGSTHLNVNEIDLGEIETTIPKFNEVSAFDIPEEATDAIADQVPHILIVEDNADLRHYLREQLKPHYGIIEAENGEEGVSKAILEVPDLIISDLMMPKMDGLQLCGEVKANEKTSHIPVILLTAKADIETKLSGLHIGADDYIAKPFDARELEARIYNLIDSRKILQHKFSQHFSLSATEITVDSLEDRFLKKVKSTIEAQLGIPTFTIEMLAAEVAMSTAQFYRKLKALTGYTPNDLIRNIRLERAASLLRQHAGNVSDVAYQVGFNNLSYFAKVFKEKFGVVPSEFEGNDQTQ